MRRAFVLAAQYPKESGYPNAATWSVDGEYVAAWLSQHGYQVERASSDDKSLLELRNLIRSSEPTDSLIVYFAGYVLLTSTGEPALLLGGSAPATLGIATLLRRMTTRLGSVCVVLDGRCGSQVQSAVRVSNQVVADRVWETACALETSNADVLVRLQPWRGSRSDSVPTEPRLYELLEELVSRSAHPTARELHDMWLERRSDSEVRHAAGTPSFEWLQVTSSRSAAPTPLPTVAIEATPPPRVDLAPQEEPARELEPVRSNESDPPTEARSPDVQPEAVVPLVPPAARAPSEQDRAPSEQDRASPEPGTNPASTRTEHSFPNLPSAVLAAAQAHTNQRIRPSRIVSIQGPPAAPQPEPAPASWVASSEVSRSNSTSTQIEEAELAQVVEETQDTATAIALVEAFLDVSPTSREGFELLVRLLSQANQWERLAAACRQLIPRQTNPRDVVRLSVAHARVCATQLSDPARAARSLERACELEPHEVRWHLEAAGLHELSGDVDAARAHYFAALHEAPLDANVHYRLSAFFSWCDVPDLAWQSAAILQVLGEHDEAVTALYERYCLNSLHQPTRSLGPDEWSTRLEPGFGDAEFARWLELISDAALGAYDANEEYRRRLLNDLVEEPVMTSTTTLAKSLEWSCQLLELQVPVLYLTEQDGVLAPLPFDEPAWVASRTLARGLSQQESVFLWARSLARNSGRARVLRVFSDDEMLETLLVSSFLLAGNAVNPAPANALELGRVLKRLVSEATRTELRALLSKATLSDWTERMHRWQDEVALTANRVALLACGDPAVAAVALQTLGHTDQLLQAELSDLFTFALSEPYHALRRDLGIAAEAAEPTATAQSISSVNGP